MDGTLRGAKNGSFNSLLRRKHFRHTFADDDARRMGIPCGDSWHDGAVGHPEVLDPIDTQLPVDNGHIVRAHFCSAGRMMPFQSACRLCLKEPILGLMLQLEMPLVREILSQQEFALHEKSTDARRMAVGISSTQQAPPSKSATKARASSIGNTADSSASRRYAI